MALVFLAHPGRRHPALLASSRSPAHRNHFAAAAADNGAKVFGPNVQGLSLFLLISRPIINSGDTGLVAWEYERTHDRLADVVQHRLDDMRLYSEFGHPGGSGAAQIM